MGGLYLSRLSTGDHLPIKGKAAALVADGATLQTTPAYVFDRSVCVAENEAFDAAAFAFSADEFAVFMLPDRRGQRVKWWLLATPEQIAANFTAREIASYRNDPYARRVRP